VEIAGEFVEAVGRLAARFPIEFVVELLVKGPGAFLARRFRPEADPDGLLALAAGVTFWALVGFGVFWGWRCLAAGAA
jgi:hypothetical protein